MKLTDYGLLIKKAAEKGLIFDLSSSFVAKLDDKTGFLTSPVNLSRTGVQHYMGFELGLTDRAMEKIGVFRDPKQVFHPDSIKSFTNLVVTDDHPNDFVTVDNVKKLQVGSVSDVAKDGDVLKGTVTITDKGMIDKIGSGKVEVSVGYENNLKKQSGDYLGVKYDYVQTDIRANHLAIVDAGRCGSACKITMDKKRRQPVKITILDIDYDVEDEQLAQAIQKQQSAHDAEKEGLKKKLEEEEMEKKKAIKEKDKAFAAKDAAETLVLDDDKINKLVSDRALLLTTAKEILGDKMPDCGDCPREIKAAVIDKILDLGDLSKKSDDYINASFDFAIEQSKKAKKSLDSLANDFEKKTVTDKDGKEVTRDSAREKYMADKLSLETQEGEV